MGGILLSRPVSKVEIVNDKNARLINWWRTVRDNPDQLAHLVAMTPGSRDEYQWAKAHMDGCLGNCNCHIRQQFGECPPLYQALAFHTVLRDGITKGDGVTNWFRVFSIARGQSRSAELDWQALTMRLRSVQIENCDAIALLERTMALPDVVAYVDPPYPDSNTSAYALGAIDKSVLADVLRKQKGRVALSGNIGEYDDLLPGWRREIYHTHRITPVEREGQSKKERTECLWLNYPTEVRLL